MNTTIYPLLIDMRSSLFVLIVVIGLTASGCSLFKDTANTDAPRTTLEVVNNNFYDVSMFIIRSNQRIRIGFVQSNTTQILEIPAYVASAGGMVFFHADPVGGGRSPFSEERYVEEGRQTRIVIPSI